MNFRHCLLRSRTTFDNICSLTLSLCHLENYVPTFLEWAIMLAILHLSCHAWTRLWFFVYSTVSATSASQSSHMGRTQPSIYPPWMAEQVARHRHAINRSFALSADLLLAESRPSRATLTFVLHIQSHFEANNYLHDWWYGPSFKERSFRALLKKLHPSTFLHNFTFRAP